jgi:pimeloyl-ACP methyl ester carboxylesterase
LPRAAWLALALLLSCPALTSVWALFVSGSFLVEFLSEGRWRPLSAITREVPVRALPVSIAGRAIPTDLYGRDDAALASPGLVLVHGLSALGKDDPRLRQAALLLARAGWAVAVPTVAGLTVLRLRPDDAEIVVAAVRALQEAHHRPVAILGVSLGSGPALLAAEDPRVASSISAVLALGGYASTVELLRYTLTGAFRFDGVSGRRPVSEPAIKQFARANADLVGVAGRRLVDNREPRLVDELVAALPIETRRLLAELSPEETIARLRAPLVLIHGRDDPAVPFTESLRLEQAARAAGRPVSVVIVSSRGHTDPALRAGTLDLVRLGGAFYAFRTLASSLGGPGS